MPAPIGRNGVNAVSLGSSFDRDLTPQPQPAAADATRVAGWTPGGRRAVTTEPAPSVALPDDIEHSNGAPVFKQGDARWGATKLGADTTIARSGCAMTSTAMAMSAITNDPITPDVLNSWLKSNHGFAGDALDWSRVGKARGLEVRREVLTLKNIDANLDAGKPVVLGVDYKAGSNGGANGTDHWICITGKTIDDQGKVSYSANDPGTGKVVTLRPNPKGGLVGDGKDALGVYRSTGELRVFLSPEPA